MLINQQKYKLVKNIHLLSSILQSLTAKLMLPLKVKLELYNITLNNNTSVCNTNDFNTFLSLWLKV